MRKSTRNLLAVVALLPFLGAGCHSGDAALVIDFVNDWLVQRGIIDEEGNPSLSTVAYVGSGGWMSTGNEENDAIIDAGQAVKNINDADKKAERALDDAQNNDHDSAHEKLDDVLDERPGDHHVRNAKGSVLVHQGASGADEYLASRSSCGGSFHDMSLVQRRRCMIELEDEDAQLAGLRGDPNSSERSTGEEACRVASARVHTLGRLHDLTVNLASGDATTEESVSMRTRRRLAVYDMQQACDE